MVFHWNGICGILHEMFRYTQVFEKMRLHPPPHRQTAPFANNIHIAMSLEKMFLSLELSCTFVCFDNQLINGGGDF